jgi:formate dehydrogenase major subunit
MKLTKVSSKVVDSSLIDKKGTAQKAAGKALSRRQFLRSSSLMAGGAALGTTLAPGMMKKAEAAGETKGAIKRVKTICTHCSVGCGVIAEVENGVWTGQEPALDHPFNKGAHCA